MGVLGMNGDPKGSKNTTLQANLGVNPNKLLPTGY